MTPEQAKMRGRMATLLFCVFGVVGWLSSPYETHFPALAIIYALLMVQTWFSLPLFFQHIDPADLRQRVIDVAIAFSYAHLAFSLRDPPDFFFAWTIFFCLTVLKYSMLVGRFPHPRLLRRKLTANVLGIAMGILIYSLLVYDLRAQWLGVILFGGACAQYLILRPLYVTDKV